MSLVHYERRGPIATIRLNHPEEYNAPFEEMLLALSELLEEIRNTTEIRVVILTSEGPDAFCAGSDVGELTALNEDQAGRFPTHLQTVCNRIENYHVPVIAAVDGLAAGGGCELALACHLQCLLAEAESLANEIAKLAPLAIRACLEAVIKGADLPLDEGLALETQLFASLFATEDVREGTRAFLEKRKPVFKGT